MANFLLAAFVIGYGCIAMEHPLRIDKAALAILTGIVCWVILSFGIHQMPFVAEGQSVTATLDTTAFIASSLSHHLASISEILFFLMGAMTIVELMDAHGSFSVITNKITTTHQVRFLWIISLLTFFLSAVLDNMTTAIIMCALLRRMGAPRDATWVTGGFVIIAANAGGAWSPIGDVTTIMLWIGGQVTALNIIKATFLASLGSLIIPLVVASLLLKTNNAKPDATMLHGFNEKTLTTPFEQKFIFFLGCAGLLSVPLFKAITHLPPYMGILLALSVVWVATEIIHRRKEHEQKRGLAVAAILQRIDTPGILFFLGILLAVSALETSGHLSLFATALTNTFNNIYLINTFLGLISAIVDNVPIVAATMGMFDMNVYPTDHDFWELLAYCAGTGGSILIFGSAAGVAAMGILKIDFMWYLKKISWYALLGYLSGIAIYYLQHNL